MEIEPLIIGLFLCLGFAFLRENFRNGFFSGRKQSTLRKIIPIESILKKENLTEELITKADLFCTKLSLLGLILSLISIPIYFFFSIDILVSMAILLIFLIFPLRLIYFVYFIKVKKKY